MENMIDNLINGNCTEARKMSKRFTVYRIVDHLTDLGWTQDRAFKCARFLKTGEGFQAYCDAA
jgi:hypothetical protein